MRCLIEAGENLMICSARRDAVPRERNGFSSPEYQKNAATCRGCGGMGMRRGITQKFPSAIPLRASALLR